MPVKLARLWQARLGGRLTACTVAGPTVFAAAIAQHRLCALDAGDGSLLWDYTAGGRVDTPPTIYRGLVLFGSADGWVHCLRASDGELAWRFRAAPQERRVVAFGRLESPWPVHGTVLVADGVAYVAAGRSTHLDGGIRVCAIRPDTGQLIRELKTLNAQPHGLEDVLVADGGSVFMRHLEFSLKAGPQPAAPEKGKGRRGLSKKAGAGSPVTSRAFSTAGLLDDSWFSRVGWGGGGGKSGGAELLVFNDQSTFAIRTRRKGGFGGWFQPASGAYELVAFDKGGKNPRWSKTVPIRVRAMVAAGKTLFVAGPPDAVGASDPWAAFEGRKGGVLRAVSVGDGGKLAEYPLDSPPVHDGLVAAGGRLYLSALDGHVVCLAARP